MSHPGDPDARTGYGDKREARAQTAAEKAYRTAQRPGSGRSAQRIAWLNTL